MLRPPRTTSYRLTTDVPMVGDSVLVLVVRQVEALDARVVGATRIAAIRVEALDDVEAVERIDARRTGPGCS